MTLIQKAPKFSAMESIDHNSTWEKEVVITDYETFYTQIEEGIASAREAIDFESYIFDDDEIGRKIVRLLKDAAKKCVLVRIMVDGYGSPKWADLFLEDLLQAGVHARVYHPLPRHVIKSLFNRFPSADLFWNSIASINKRNHRKVCIIDKNRAWLGGMNISASHMQWRDTSVYLEGGPIESLVNAYDQTWSKAWAPFQKKKIPRIWSKIRNRFSISGLVHLNTNRKLRKKAYQDLLQRFSSASKRIWITNAYFIPPRKLLRVLQNAALKGVDVKLIVPKHPDIIFVHTISSSLYYGLLKSGAQIFEYAPVPLHSKTLLVDGFASIGSSNMNHRSLLHDLEVDAVLTKPESILALERIFSEDLKNSEKVTIEKWTERGFIEKILGKILLNLQYWM